MKTIHALIVGTTLLAASTSFAAAQTVRNDNDVTAGGQRISETKTQAYGRTSRGNVAGDAEAYQNGQRIDRTDRRARYRDHHETRWGSYGRYDNRMYGWNEPAYGVTFWPFSNFMAYEDDPVYVDTTPRYRVRIEDRGYYYRDSYAPRRGMWGHDPSHGANSGR